MKVSRQQATENRARVVEAASRLFREHGFEGVGVADIMRAADLTHGGFYANFAGKSELEIEAVEAAFAETVVSLKVIAARSEDPLRSIVEYYLSPAHRDQPGVGCVVAALAPDATRAGLPLRDAFERGIKTYLGLLGDFPRLSGP
jgi:TetR/AcrR family transcriptional repressor of nem operon